MNNYCLFFVSFMSSQTFAGAKVIKKKHIRKHLVIFLFFVSTYLHI